MKVLTAGSSKTGLREHNQDSWGKVSVEDVTLLAVADGNGGEGGQELSALAVKTAISEICWALSHGDGSIDSEDELKQLGLQAMKKAVEEVIEAKKQHEEWAEAGTTMTLVLLKDDKVAVFWIGDSPCYLYEAGVISLLTNPPHTLAEMLIAEGGSREAIKNQPSLNSILTLCLGHDSCEPDVKIAKVTAPYVVLVGCDGVFNYLSEEAIKQMLVSRLNSDVLGFDVQKFADEVVQTALDNDSDDNCTAVAALALPDFRLNKSSRRITKLIEWRD